MAGWELALVIVAATFMIVNVVSLLVQVALIVSYKDLILKGVKLMEKLMDKSGNLLDKWFKEMEDEEL